MMISKCGWKVSGEEVNTSSRVQHGVHPHRMDDRLSNLAQRLRQLQDRVFGRERSNRYALWTACSRCGLRLTYVAKGRHQGDTRAVEPPRELVLPTQANEKIFQGKLMEVKGRELVNTHGTIETIHLSYQDTGIGASTIDSGGRLCCQEDRQEGYPRGG